MGEVWRGSLRDSEYIAANPVKAGLVDSPEEYVYCLGCLAKKAAGAKAQRG
jgi:hypothetical protein